MPASDPHSRARAADPRVRHVSIDLAVDFAERRLTGTAALDLDRAADEIVLDSWLLDIREVRADGRRASYDVSHHDPVLGSALTVRLDGASRVEIDYRTDPTAKAVQWLDPPQTASGEPFLYTQSQPVLARSWVPLQDTPSVRFTYDATVRVPAHLMALMSAANPTELGEGTYRFTMAQPVPSYLLALAVGALEFRPLGERVGVYAEPSVIKAAAWEFADMDAMMTLAEGLYGPYRWDRFDVLVLPPSFPYGGMENPRLTFATPTLLAGDRSLTSVVAHELAHSWSGNLVTNATWDDMWLNEGFTTYFEHRIIEALLGAPVAEMGWELGRQDLLIWGGEHDSDHGLAGDFAGRNPELAASAVAYHKGSLFLRLLEETAGRAAFDAFLAGYFAEFAFRSMDTAGFVSHLRTHLLEPAGIDEAALRLDDWLHGPCLPGNAPIVSGELFRLVDVQLARLQAGGSADDVDASGWRTEQWKHFVRGIPVDADPDLLAALDARFGFTDSGNGEILTAWFELAIESGNAFAVPAVDASLERFLRKQGRRKFIEPLYRHLMRTPEGATRAREIYALARPTYHPVGQAYLDAVVLISS